MRLGKTQNLIVQYIRERGAEHVYLGCGANKGCLTGYFWEEIERSLAALIRRGIVIEKKRGFYALPSDAAN